MCGTQQYCGGWRLAGLTELCVEDVLHTLRLKSHLAFCGSNVAPRGALKIADRLPIFKSVGPHSQGKWPEVSMDCPFRQGMGPPPCNQCLLLQTQPGLTSSRTRSCPRSELQHPWMVNVRGRLESLEESRLPTPWGSPGRCWRRELGWGRHWKLCLCPPVPFFRSLSTVGFAKVTTVARSVHIQTKPQMGCQGVQGQHGGVLEAWDPAMALRLLCALYHSDPQLFPL